MFILLFFYLMSCFAIHNCQLNGLNLFITKEEAKRTMGANYRWQHLSKSRRRFFLDFDFCLDNCSLHTDLNHEYNYIRNGQVLDYALSFIVPIPYFTRRLVIFWENKDSVKNGNIHYKLDVAVAPGNLKGLDIFQVGPTTGLVPRKLSNFTVDPICTGKQDGFMFFNISINFSQKSTTKKDVTKIVLMRKKMCKSGLQQIRLPIEYDNSLAIEDKNNSKLWFYVGIGAFSTIVIIIAIVIAICFVCKRPKEVQKNKSYTIDRASENGSSKYSQVLLPNTSDSSQSHTSNSLRHSMELTSNQVRTALAELLIDKSRLTLTQVLTEGSFGRLSHGLITVNSETDEMGFILVKSLTEVATEEQIEAFFLESCLLKNVTHENVQKLAGVCFDPPILIYPRSTYTQNLKTYLLDRKTMVLSTPEVVYIALQIARGLMFLHKIGILHKDVAARNCTIDEQFKVQVTDYVLSRDIFPDDYQCLGDQLNKPIRWLSIECLRNNTKYSTASDAWAMSITIWEIINLGQFPYPGVNPYDIAEYLFEGYRLTQPTLCPDHLFTLMAHCWSAEPHERPSLSQIVFYLRDFYTTLGCFI